MIYESPCPDCPGGGVSDLHPVEYVETGRGCYMVVECLDCGAVWAE